MFGFAQPIPELRCHPAQLTALRAAALVEPVLASVPPEEVVSVLVDADLPEAMIPLGITECWRTAFGQRVTVSKYLPEEGLYLPDSKAAIQAEKTEAGVERRREQRRLYREKQRTRT